MNSLDVLTGIATARELVEIGQALRGVLTVGGVPVSAVVSTPAGPDEVNWSTGLSAPQTTDDSVTGFLADLTLREVEHSAGAYSVGDRRFRCMAADLSTPPTTDSIVTVGADTYAVLNAETDGLGLHHLLTLRLRG